MQWTTLVFYVKRISGETMQFVLIWTLITAGLLYLAYRARDLTDRLTWLAFAVPALATLLYPLMPQREVLSRGDAPWLAENLGVWTVGGVWLLGAGCISVLLGLSRALVHKHRHFAAADRNARLGLPTRQWLWSIGSVVLLTFVTALTVFYGGTLLLAWQLDTAGARMGAQPDPALLELLTNLTAVGIGVILVLVFNVLIAPVVLGFVQMRRHRLADERYAAERRAFERLMIRLFPDEDDRRSAYQRAQDAHTAEAHATVENRR